MNYIAKTDDQVFEIELEDETTIVVNGEQMLVDFQQVGTQPDYSLLLDGSSYQAHVYPAEGNGWQVLLLGKLYHVSVEDEREKRLKAAARSSVSTSGEFHLKSPMPGLVVSVLVEEGQSIQKGQVLLILESMKMQNELKSPQDGIVARIRVTNGQNVDQRETLLSVV